jgi:hypothetical protein
VRSYVAEKNTTFKMANVQKFTREAVHDIQASACVSCVQHTEKLQDDDFKRQISRDVILEPVVRNFGESDSKQF